MPEFRTASLAELDTILGWAAAEGWNPGLEDAAAFQAADPQGFFVATVAGRPVAAISVVNHTADFAFLGLYLVIPEHRGKGIGYGLWQHAMTHAGARVVGLDGVPDQQSNYVASGFAHAGATTRFAGIVEGQVQAGMRAATVENLHMLIDWEASFSGVAKPAYLSAWCAQAPTRKTWLLEGPDGVVGACTVRQCREGAKIGPLMARDQAGAEALLRHAAAGVEGPLVLDVPQASAPLAALCREWGMEAGFHTARMYRGKAPTGAEGYFSVCSLELG